MPHQFFNPTLGQACWRAPGSPSRPVLRTGRCDATLRGGRHHHPGRPEDRSSRGILTPYKKINTQWQFNADTARRDSETVGAGLAPHRIAAQQCRPSDAISRGFFKMVGVWPAGLKVDIEHPLETLCPAHSGSA